MRAQHCREKILQVAEECGLSDATVEKQVIAGKFCIDHPAFSDCATDAVLTIVTIKDPYVKRKVLAEAEAILKTKSPDGKRFIKKRLTVGEVNAILVKYQPPEKVEEKKAKEKLEAAKKEVRSTIKAVSGNNPVIELLKKEQRTVLKRMVSLKYAPNEYESLILAIRWAGEKLPKAKK